MQAFEAIEDKNTLAWSVLDTKSELAVNLAIAVSANRRAGRRVAHVEYDRIDLALLEEGDPIALYEAKAAYMTDFQERRIAKRDPYLGGCVDEDLKKLATVGGKWKSVRQRACLFYLYEVSKPSRQLKYGRHPAVTIEQAFSGLESLVTTGLLVAQSVIDCGTADGAAVRIHLCVFDPA